MQLGMFYPSMKKSAWMPQCVKSFFGLLFAVGRAAICLSRLHHGWVSPFNYRPALRSLNSASLAIESAFLIIALSILICNGDFGSRRSNAVPSWPRSCPCRFVPRRRGPLRLGYIFTIHADTKKFLRYYSRFILGISF